MRRNSATTDRTVPTADCTDKDMGLIRGMASLMEAPHLLDHMQIGVAQPLRVRTITMASAIGQAAQLQDHMATGTVTKLTKRLPALRARLITSMVMSMIVGMVMVVVASIGMTRLIRNLVTALSQPHRRRHLRLQVRPQRSGSGFAGFSELLPAEPAQGRRLPKSFWSAPRLCRRPR